MNPFDGSTGVHLGFADPMAKASAFGVDAVKTQTAPQTVSKVEQQQSAAAAAAPKAQDLPSRESIARGIIDRGTLTERWGNWMLASHHIEQLTQALDHNTKKRDEAVAWLAAADKWLDTKIGGSATAAGKAVEVKYPFRALFKVFIPRIDAQIAAAESAFGKAFSNYVTKPTVGWKLAVFQPSVVPSLSPPYTQTEAVWNFRGYVTNQDPKGSFQQAKADVIGVPGQNHGPKYGGPDPKCCKVAGSANDAKALLDTAAKYREKILALRPLDGTAAQNFDGTWMGKNFVGFPWWWVYTQVKDYTGTPWKNLHAKLVQELAASVANRKQLFAPFMKELLPLFSASGVPVTVAPAWIAAGAPLDPFMHDGKQYDPNSAGWVFLREAREKALATMQGKLSWPTLTKAWNSSATAVSECDTMLSQAAHIEGASAKYAETRSKLEALKGTLTPDSDLSAVSALQDAADKAKKDVEFFVGNVANTTEKVKVRVDEIREVVATFQGIDLGEKEKTRLSEIAANLAVCDAALTKVGKTLQQSLVTIDSQLPQLTDLQKQITDSTGEDPPGTIQTDEGGGGVMAALAAAAALLLLRG